MEQEMMQRLIDDGEFEETINKPVEPDNGRPFQLANPAVNRSLLTRSKFVDVRVELIEASVWLGSDVPDVLGFLHEHLASARTAFAFALRPCCVPEKRRSRSDETESVTA